MEDDYPLLNTPNLVALILRAAGSGGISAERCAGRLKALFGPGGPPVGRDALVARCATHLRWLREAGLVEPADGHWTITAGGRAALEAHPDGMDVAELAGYPGFAAYLEAEDAAERPSGGPEKRAGTYDEGFAARHDGAAFTDNPYDFATADHQLWEKGWCEALDEEAGPGLSALTGRRRDAN